MAYFEWAQDMVIDDGPIDADHRRLIAQANELHTATSQGQGHSVVGQLLEQLLADTAEPGESFGLLGPNGAGKSTTMKMIGAVSTRSGGDLQILGLDPGRSAGPAERSRASRSATLGSAPVRLPTSPANTTAAAGAPPITEANEPCSASTVMFSFKVLLNTTNAPPW